MDEARVITLSPALHPLQHQFQFQRSSSSSLHVRFSLLLHQPWIPLLPIPEKSTATPTPHPPSLTCAPAGLPPPLPSQMDCACVGGAVCASLGSARLSPAQLNLLCDYCQSETPPSRRSAVMGTIWHRAQPAMEAGIREQRRYRTLGWGKDTEAGKKYC